MKDHNPLILGNPRRTPNQGSQGTDLVTRHSGPSEAVGTSEDLIAGAQSSDDRSVFAMGRGSSLVHPLRVDRKTYVALATDPEIVARVNALIKEGKSPQEAINIVAEGAWLSKRKVRLPACVASLRELV